MWGSSICMHLFHLKLFYLRSLFFVIHALSSFEAGALFAQFLAKLSWADFASVQLCALNVFSKADIASIYNASSLQRQNVTANFNELLEQHLLSPHFFRHRQIVWMNNRENDFKQVHGNNIRHGVHGKKEVDLLTLWKMKWVEKLNLHTCISRCTAIYERNAQRKLADRLFST